MFRILFTLALTLLLAAPSALADPTEGVEIARKIKAKKVEKTFHGTWRIELPPEIERSLKILTLALTEGPDADLGPLDLTPEEAQIFHAAIAGLASAGDEADEIRKRQLAEVQAAAKGMEIHVREGSMELVVGSQRTTASWEVLRSRANHLEIKSSREGEPAQLIEVTFVDRDRALLAADGQQTVELRRFDPSKE